MLTLLKRITRLLTSSSLLLALDGPLIVLFGYLLYGTPINWVIIAAAFLAVFSVYNLNKATDRVEDSINRPQQNTKPAAWYVIPSTVTMILSLWLGLSVSLSSFIILLLPFVVGFFYSVKLRSRVPRLKEIIGAKSVMVAFTWSLCGALLPLCSTTEGTAPVLLVFTYIFLQVTVNTILFDTLDVKGDGYSGLKTVPIALGKVKTKWLLIAINSVLLAWLALCGLEGFFITYLPALGFGIFYGYVLIWHFLRENKGNRLCAEFLVDGQWLPIVLLIRLCSLKPF
jgi:4-hydroxybenzoate polyprenyltransferase